MKDKSNSRKRYIVAGVLLALALLIGIDRCNNEQPEEIPNSNENVKDSVPDSHSLSVITSTDTIGFHSRVFRHKKVERKHLFQARKKETTQPLQHDKGQVTQEDSTVTPSTTITLPEETPVTPPIETDQTAVSSDHQDPLTVPTSSRFPKFHLFRWGLRAGGGYSTVSHLGSMIENFDIRPRFTMKEQGGFSPQIGMYISWQYRRMGIELGADYFRLGGKVSEYKELQQITETTEFHYNSISPLLLFRCYATPQLYMGVGMSATIPFGVSSISFTNHRSDPMGQQQSVLTQSHLRDAFKSKIILMPTLRLGFTDKKTGWEASLEYRYGLNDFLDTHPNDYGYSEQPNRAQYVGFTIGYSLPLTHPKE